MKKTTCLALAFFLCVATFALYGCAEKSELFPFVSELRENIYEGESENYRLRAAYGFKENPPASDGAVNKTVKKLTFKLLGKETDGVTYTLIYSANGTDIKATFALNPVSGSLSAAIETDAPPSNEFTVSLSAGGNSEEVVLTSLLPEGTLTAYAALNVLSTEQKALVDAYRNASGVFSAEIYARVTVKNGKPYWYIGLDKGNGELKAFLIDGLTGEVLAIREII